MLQYLIIVLFDLLHNLIILRFEMFMAKVINIPLKLAKWYINHLRVIMHLHQGNHPVSQSWKSCVCTALILLWKLKPPWHKAVLTSKGGKILKSEANWTIVLNNFHYKTSRAFLSVLVKGLKLEFCSFWQYSIHFRIDEALFQIHNEFLYFFCLKFKNLHDPPFTGRNLLYKIKYLIANGKLASGNLAPGFK